MKDGTARHSVPELRALPAPVGIPEHRLRAGNKKIERAERDRRIRAAAGTLGLGDLLGRKPGQLSGGQRVAMGRALVREPSVFLMDEPLSNLDAKLRVQMRSEVLRVHRSLYDRPANIFVATLIGSPSMNLYEAGLSADGSAR
jgi:ABC-type sugar transport system ATPase subunit